MITARDIMTADAAYIGSDDTLGAAAAKMRDLDVGWLPVCEGGRHLAGVLTDRDIVVRCIADGRDPYTSQVGDYAQDSTPAIGVDDSLETALMTMAEHRLHRLPVIDGHDLVGMLVDVDVAQSLPAVAIDDVLRYVPRQGRRLSSE